MKIISISAWAIFFLIFVPEVAPSELKKSQDQAPQFLFVLNSHQGSNVTEGGSVEILQFSKKHISAVEMLSNRSRNVRSEFRQLRVRGLWKLRDLTFKKSAKATLSASHLRTHIVEINGIEVTPSHVRYWIVPVDRGPPIPGSPLLNASVCYGERIIRSDCADCECCP